MEPIITNFSRRIASGIYCASKYVGRRYSLVRREHAIPALSLSHTRKRTECFPSCGANLHSPQTMFYNQNHVNFTTNANPHQDFVDRDTESTGDEILSKLEGEEAKKFKILQLEYDVFFSTGHRIPSEMKTEMWLHLLNECTSVYSRKKMYHFWFKREKAKMATERKKEARRQQREQHIQAKEDSEHYENTIYQRFSKSKMNKQLYAPNLLFSMLHGPHLVFDLAFQDQMTDHELQNLTTQLKHAHGQNHVNTEPFHFHFCNLPPNSKMEKTLHRRFPGLDDIMYTITEKNYLDLYPRENLVYLSPNAPSFLTTYNPRDIYIIGGIVDKAVEDPLTFAKAKRENIRCAKLPLDKYVDWVQGSKALTLDQMVNIMLTLKDTDSNWEEAMKHVPARKFRWRNQ